MFCLLPFQHNFVLFFIAADCTKAEDDVILFYSRHCTGAVEWAKYLHKLYTELSKHKGRLRYAKSKRTDLIAM